MNPGLKKAIHDGVDFLYFDNAYFHRGPRSHNFRLIRGALHLTYVLDRPHDRLRQRWGIEAAPWKKTGRNVIVIPPSPYHAEIYGAQNWLEETLKRIQTDRPVIVKRVKAEPLAPLLEDAWCMVTYASVAGVEALLAGVPVFSGPICPTLPMSSGGVENIETPLYPEREPWLRSLAYAQWGMDELDKIDIESYDYR